jgi:hypothetical protein
MKIIQSETGLGLVTDGFTHPEKDMNCNRDWLKTGTGGATSPVQVS